MSTVDELPAARKVTVEPRSRPQAAGWSGTRETIRVLRAGFPDRPPLDTAIARVLLMRASDGLEPPSLRLHVPAAVVAFGRQDIASRGYAAAVAAARAQGFEAIERLGGGRAAVFHDGTLSFAWTVPESSPRDRIRARYEELAAIMASALRRLGVDARVGEVPGEYCPGDWSVNARGRTKLMGVGQRVAAHAAHVGGVVVVHGADRIRDVLIPVYEALGLAWDPSTVGAIDEEVSGITLEGVANAILEEFAARYTLVDGALAPELVAEAERLAAEHLSPLPDTERRHSGAEPRG